MSIIIEAIWLLTLTICGSIPTMADKPKVFIGSSELIEAGLEILKPRCELIRVEKNSTVEDFVDIIIKANGVDAIIWSGHKKPTDDLFDAAGPNLKIFASVSAGVDHLNVSGIKSHGIPVTNTPSVLSASVAEVAILLTLAAAHRLEEGRQKIVNNEWDGRFQWLLGHDLVGSTVGIIGFGSIGQAIAKRLKMFEVGEILYSGHKAKPEGEELGAKFVSQRDLLEQSDFVISAVPLTKETESMFNKTTFGQMKNSAIFVNVGRGAVVNQDDLVEALQTNEIFAAGLDVMTPEPLPADHILTKLPNCVLIPHLGSATWRTRTAMVELAAKNVLAALDNKPLLTRV